jgi:hypothetical protein
VCLGLGRVHVTPHTLAARARERFVMKKTQTTSNRVGEVASSTSVSMAELYLDGFVVPAGTYTVKVHGANYMHVARLVGTSSYYRLRLIIAGPSTKRCEQYIGHTVLMDYPINGPGTYHLFELLDVTGHKPEFELESADQLIGLEFRAAIGVQPQTAALPTVNVVQKHLPLRKL